MNKKAPEIIYITAPETWNNVTEGLLESCFSALNIPIHWVSSNFPVDNEYIIRKSKLTFINVSTIGIIKVKSFTGINMMTYYIVNNPSSDLIVRMSKVMALKVFL